MTNSYPSERTVQPIALDTSQLPGRGIKPLLSLRRHFRVSVVIWLLVLLAGLPVVWIKGKSTYYTESTFQVFPEFIKTLSNDSEVLVQSNSNSNYRQYVNHLSTTVRRYDVLQRAVHALQEKNIDPKPAGMTERQWIEDLQKKLLVLPMPDTYMVRIGFESGAQQHLDELVNAVTNAFINTARSEQLYGSEERMATLQENLVQLQKEISQLEDKRLLLAEPLGLTTFKDGVSNPYDSTLAEARQKYTIASVERIQAEAIYAAYLKQSETPVVAGRSLLEMLQTDHGLQLLRTEVTRRSEELKRIMAGLQSQHPARKPAELELNEITQRLQSMQREVQGANYASVKSRLLATVLQTRQVEVEVKKQMEAIERQAVGYARNWQQAMRITNDISKREKELNDIRDRYNFLSKEREAIGFVRLVTPALPAILPRGIGKTKLLLLVLVLASGLALAAPVAIDMLDRRIYTVNEAEKLLGMPAAGWQVEMTNLPSQLYAKEQTRRLASTLLRDKARGGGGVFAFSAIKSESRAMRVALDTAAVLRQLGVNVLVVDANSFVSSEAFAQDRAGLTDYLAGDVGLEELVHSVLHQDQLLDGVGIGQQQAFGIQRLDRFKQAVEDWQSQYDFVLLGLPPLLLSADAELLVGALGQVFMVLEAQVVNRGEIGRAKRMLEKLNPEAVGLFVDNVPLFSGRGSGYMDEVVLETISKTSMDKFMSLSGWKLQYELLRTRWALWRVREPRRSQKSS